MKGGGSGARWLGLRTSVVPFSWSPAPPPPGMDEGNAGGPILSLLGRVSPSPSQRQKAPGCCSLVTRSCSYRPRIKNISKLAFCSESEVANGRSLGPIQPIHSVFGLKDFGQQPTFKHLRLFVRVHVKTGGTAALGKCMVWGHMVLIQAT